MLHTQEVERARQLAARYRREAERLAAEMGKPAASNDIEALVKRYEEKWPQLCAQGQMWPARRAMEIVLRGGLYRLPDAPDGTDRWAVGTHLCSKRGGGCDCEEPAYVDSVYGKLCRHRLAVAIKTNWNGDACPELLDMFVGFDRQLPYVDLLVERIYEWHGEGASVTVIGYKLPRTVSGMRFSRDQAIPFTLPQFQRALAESDWSMADLPEKLSGYNYYYRIQPGNAGMIASEVVFWHRGRTDAMRERARSRRMILEDIALHIDAALSGPLPVHLSQYEAQQVYELRCQLCDSSMTAAQVFAALPADLQVRILESEGVEYAD